MFYIGGGGGGESEVAGGGEVWGAVPPWVTGTHQQYAVAAAGHLAPRPAALGALEAAAIPYTGLTAMVPFVHP